MKRKICVVTGTRAEYGLLFPLIKKIQQDSAFQLQLLVTGMHLSSEFGDTYKQIESDGFTIDEKVEMLLSADTATGVVKSMGLATIGFADAFARLQPELIIILGDRFEMLAAAQSALLCKYLLHICTVVNVLLVHMMMRFVIRLQRWQHGILRVPNRIVSVLSSLGSHQNMYLMLEQSALKIL